MQHNLFTTMRSLKLIDGCKGTQVYAINPSGPTAGGGGGGIAGGGAGDKLLHHFQDHLRVNSIRSKSSQTHRAPSQTSTVFNAVLPYGLPITDLLEPQIEPYLKSVDFVETLADLYRRIENCPQFEKSGTYLEQCAIFRGLPDPKLFRRSLRCARQHAVDVHRKIVLAAWLRFERREDELIGTTAMDCCGRNLECPKATLVSGYDPESVYDSCVCTRTPRDELHDDISIEDEECSTSDDERDISFCIGNDEIRCVRYKIASLSRPFTTMLYGSFMESRREKINFSQNGISVEAMRAAEIYSRIKRLDDFDPCLVLELLSFANRFCCEEMKSACDSYLASLVYDIEDAALLIEYGLEETAYLLVAACLQVLLRELPTSMQNPNVARIFCSAESRERLAMVGHASFVLYFFLSQVAMEEDMKSNTTVMLLERLVECATESWQKQLAFHQLGVVMLEREEYKDAQIWFDEAVEAGHSYSMVGVARTKFKRGHKYSAYKLMNSLFSDYIPVGWMYQERSMYCAGREKIMDLNSATELDPTLSYPYKYRAVMSVEENKHGAAIAEINRILGFKVSPDCLELRAWISIALEDYESALRDVRALMTLDPNYMMFYGQMRGDHLIEVLQPLVQQCSQADCWMQLYDRWSSVDDIGSLAVVHHMLAKDPGKSLLRFRQSLLLLRLNSQKAAMRSLRLARNSSSSEHERLVYEGWILYDTGHREEALSKAEESISLQRSFEAFFLKAYALSDQTFDPESAANIIQFLEEALRCPSDGLRKGQALNNLGSVYVDCEKLDLAADCYMNALNIKHTRAHQGLARVYHLRNQRKTAYDEMTKLIEKARNNASAYEKRSEYCDRDMAKSDLSMATQLDPMRTYPYRYRAAVLMDDHKEAEAIKELSRAITFKPDLQLLHLRAAFHDSIGDNLSTRRDCEAALCLDPNHTDTLDLYSKAKEKVDEQQTKSIFLQSCGKIRSEMEEEKGKAMNYLTCPRKQINFNAPLLSTKRPGRFTDEEMCCKFQDTSDRIPFCWEQAPGKPKDSDRRDSMQDCETETPRLRIPPGRWHQRREFTSNSDDLHFFQARDHHQNDGCDSDIDDGFDADNNEDNFFSDAVDVLSLTEALDIVENAENSHGLDGFYLGSLGHDESISPSYIIERFLPDAAALAASSVLSFSKNLSGKLPYNSSQACVPQAVRRSYSVPKGCGLEMLFPWRMKDRICGAKSPTRQESSANVQPEDPHMARNRSRLK